MADLVKWYKDRKKDVSNASNSVRDVFDANSQADQQKRVAAGQSRLYADQQRNKGINRISNNPAQRAINTGKAFAEGVVEAPKYLTTGVAESLAYNTDAQKNARASALNLQNITNSNIGLASSKLKDPTIDLAAKQRFNRLLNDQVNTSSNTFKLANQRNQQVQSRTDPVKGAASLGQVGFDTLTLGVGSGARQAATQAAKQGKVQLAKSLATSSLKTGATGATSGAISPFVMKGSDVNRRDVAISAAGGAILGGALPSASYIAPKVIASGAQKSTQVAQKFDDSLAPSGLVQQRNQYQVAFDKETNPVRRRQISKGIADLNSQIRTTQEGGYAKIPDPKIPPKQSRKSQTEMPVSESSYSDVPVRNAAQLEQSAASMPQLRNQTTTKNQTSNRGFINNIIDNNTTRPELRQALQGVDSTYVARNTNELQMKAANLVKDDVDTAQRVAKSGTDDNAVAVASELIKKYQNEGNFEAAIDIAEVIAPRLTEAGRTAQAAAMYGRLTPEGALRFAQRQLDRYNESQNLVKNGKQVGSKAPAKMTADKAKEITDQAKLIQKLPEGDEKTLAIIELNKKINTIAPTPWLEKATNIWRAGLLTSARTLEGGVIGNSTKAALDVPSQALAAGLDRFVTAPLLNKGVRSNMFTLKGGASGAAEGVRRGTTYLKTGNDPRDVGRGYDANPTNLETGDRFTNTLGKGAEMVYRTMGAIDNPFYYAGLGRATQEQALLEASKRGLKGKSKSDFVKEYGKNLSPAATEAATETARAGVFQNDTALGTIASKLKRAPQSIKDPGSRQMAQTVVDFTIPFVKIPSAVATSLADYSPAGAVLEIIKQIAKGNLNARDLNKALGQSATGSVGIVLVGTQLYNNGMLTLEAPTDDKERQLWELEGKQPFSIKIDGKWRKLNYVQPFGGLLAFGGGYERAKDDGGKNPVLAAAGAGLKSITDQSFLKGVSGSIAAVQDPQRSAQGLINNMAGSFIPNILKDVARATDDVEREVNTPVEAVKAGIPGLRQQNLPKRDPFGQIVDRKQSPTGVLLDPFKSTSEKTDPVTAEMQRLYDLDRENLGVVPTKLKKGQSFAGQDAVLTPQQLDKFEELVGKPAFDTLKSTVASPEYSSLSDEDKSAAIKRIIDGTRANNKEDFAKSNTLKDKKGNVLNFNDSKFKTSNMDVKSSEQKAADLYSSPDAEYKDALTKYNEDKKAGKLSDIADIKRSRDLAKLQVGSTYDKKVRELYGMSKAQINDYVSNSPDKDNLAKQLFEYDQKLLDAGLSIYLKFKNGLAPSARRAASGRKGKGGRKGGRTAKSTRKQVPINLLIKAGKTPSIGRARQASFNAKTPTRKITKSKRPQIPKVGKVSTPKKTKLA